MDKEAYPIREALPLSYSFDSIGPKGTIQKLVVYQPTGVPNEYNLALLDVMSDGFSDLSVSANDDMDRVLATVVETIHLFFGQHASATLIFTGSNKARTRLYRAIIGKYINRISEKFHVYGVRNDDYEEYVTDKAYDLFMIRLRYEN